MQADAEIVVAVLGGDREAFGALVSRYELRSLGDVLAGIER